MKITSPIKLGSFFIVAVSIAIAAGLNGALKNLENQQAEVFDWQTANTVRQIEWVWVSTKLGYQHDRFVSALTKYSEVESSITHDDVLDQFDIYWSWFNSLNVFLNNHFEAMLVVDYLVDTEKQMVKESSEKAASLQELAAELLPVVETDIISLRPGNSEFLQNYFLMWEPVLELQSELQTSVLNLMRESQTRQDYISKDLRNQLDMSYMVIAIIAFAALLIVGFYLMQKLQDNRTLYALNTKLQSLAAEKSRLAEEMIQLAHFDPLSNLSNRIGFHKKIDEIFESDGTHGVCFIDLDLFKLINDSAGHAAGDRLISILGEMLTAHCTVSQQQITGSSDSIPEFYASRYGGDEFVLLCSNCDAAEFEQFATSLFDKLMSIEFSYESKSYQVSASVGAYFFNSNQTSADSVMASVDAACYEAKRLGGGRLKFYNADKSPINVRQTDVHTIELIQTALRENLFTLFFQPINNISATISADNSIEILLRMMDDNGDLVSPGLFLPIAEKYGFMPKIDMWVICRAFEWLSDNDIRYVGLDHININLSGLSISDDDFVARLVSMLRSNPEVASRIYFEITETAAVRDNAAENLISIKRTGVGLSLDDFGTGFSSFGYLESLPVDQIKIDGSFICDLDSNPVHREFVRAIVTIAIAMDKQVVAEFVENQRSLEFLKQMGVHFAQGYFIARPEPLRDTQHLLKCLTNRTSVSTINKIRKPEHVSCKKIA